MLHAGVYTSVTEIAAAELIGKEFRTGWPDGDRRTRSSSGRLLVYAWSGSSSSPATDWLTISCAA